MGVIDFILGKRPPTTRYGTSVDSIDFQETAPEYIEVTEPNRQRMSVAAVRKWRRAYNKSPFMRNRKFPEHMSKDEITDEIYNLLYNEEWRQKLNANDPELLTIILKAEKDRAEYFFDFLRAETRWEVRGRWQETPSSPSSEEDNFQIEVEFYDSKDEVVGNRLMHLLYAYNLLFINEFLLYARTSPIEETSLRPDLSRHVKRRDESFFV